MTQSPTPKLDSISVVDSGSAAAYEQCKDFQQRGQPVISVDAKKKEKVGDFKNGGQEELYCGSADMMPRNLNRRVETMFPVENPAHVRRLKYEMLDAYLADTLRARVMDEDGHYHRLRAGQGVEPVDSQAWFIRRQ